MGRRVCCILVSNSNLFKIPNVYDYTYIHVYDYTYILYIGFRQHLRTYQQTKNANDVNSQKPV